MYVCMYVCICMYVCMYVCRCIYVCVYMYVCICMYVCVCMVFEKAKILVQNTIDLMFPSSPIFPIDNNMDPDSWKQFQISAVLIALFHLFLI